MASLSTTPGMTLVCNWPVPRYRLLVPDTASLVSKVLLISSMCRRRKSSSQLWSKKSARTRYRPASVARTQIMERMEEGVILKETETSYFLVLNNQISSFSGNSTLSFNGLTRAFVEFLKGSCRSVTWISCLFYFENWPFVSCLSSDCWQ